jgi:hypothetical protein
MSVLKVFSLHGTGKLLLGMELELGGGDVELLLTAMLELLGLLDEENPAELLMFAEDKETAISELEYFCFTCSSLGKFRVWLSVQDRRRVRVKPRIVNLR